MLTNLNIYTTLEGYQNQTIISKRLAVFNSKKDEVMTFAARLREKVNQKVHLNIPGMFYIKTPAKYLSP